MGTSLISFSWMLTKKIIKHTMILPWTRGCLQTMESSWQTMYCVPYSTTRQISGAKNCTNLTNMSKMTQELNKFNLPLEKESLLFEEFKYFVYYIFAKIILYFHFLLQFTFFL